jgi:hypothetical protein
MYSNSSNSDTIAHVVLQKGDTRIDFYFFAMLACYTIFLIDFSFRFIVSANKKEFLKDIFNIIDFLTSILWFILFFFFLAFPIKNLRSLELYNIMQNSVLIITNIRITLLLKIRKYSWKFKSIIETIKKSFFELVLLILTIVICMLIFSTIMYQLENWNFSSSQFISVTATFWYFFIILQSLKYSYSKNFFSLKVYHSDYDNSN